MQSIISKIVFVLLFFSPAHIYPLESQSHLEQDNASEIVEVEIRGKKQKEPMDKQTKEIIGRIKAMVERFFTLVEDPDDKHNVASSITQIVANAAELVIAATKTIKLVEESRQEKTITQDS